MTLGRFIHIAQFASQVGDGRLIMEDCTCFSGCGHVYTGNEDYLGFCLTITAVPPPCPNPVRGTLRMEKHAILAADSIAIPNVTFGEGAVVGAGSLVNEGREPGTIYAGTPAGPTKEGPKEKILGLEDKLHFELNDESGKCIPKRLRETANDGRR